MNVYQREICQSILFIVRGHVLNRFDAEDGRSEKASEIGRLKTNSTMLLFSETKTLFMAAVC